MESLYQEDLAYIHAIAYEGLAAGAAPEIVRRFHGASTEIRRVVDMGCGSGPLTKALRSSGFDVTGIDASRDLLKIAQRAVPEAQFIHASIYDVAVPSCDAVIAVGEPLSYHPKTAEADLLVQSFFKRVSKVLPIGGLLIFDVIEQGEPSLSLRSWRSGEDWAVLVDTKEEQEHGWIVRDIQTFLRFGSFYRRGREIHTLRVFDSRVLCDHLRDCGFDVETAVRYGEQPLSVRRRAFFATRR